MVIKGYSNANDYSNCNGKINGNGINIIMFWGNGNGSDYGKSNGINYGKHHGNNKSNGNCKER